MSPFICVADLPVPAAATYASGSSGIVRFTGLPEIRIVIAIVNVVALTVYQLMRHL